MTFKDFVVKIIKSNLSRHAIFMSCITIAISVFFMYSTLWLNPGFERIKSNQLNTLLAVAGTIIIIFAVFLTLYTQSLFLKSRANEFSIFISYGLTYKELLKMIWLEGAIVYIICLGLSYIVGSVFSRLFFMVSTSLLDLNSIEFRISFKSYLVTLFLFLPVVTLSLVLSSFKLRKMSVVKLNTLNSYNEYNKSRKLWAFFVGIFLIVISILMTYFATIKTINDSALGWNLIICIAICLIGVYLFIKHLSAFIIEGRRRQGDLSKLIENASFKVNYRKNYRRYFIFSLLSFGVILFMSVTYTLMNSSYDIVNRESVYTIEYQEVEAKPSGEHIKPMEIARQVGVKKISEESIDFIYMNTENMETNVKRKCSFISIIDVNKFNRIFKTEYTIPKSEVILIKFESTLSDEIKYFDEHIAFKIGESIYNYKIYEEYNRKYIGRHTFPQPILVLASSDEYLELRALVDETERGILHLLEVGDWYKQSKFSEKFHEVFIQTNRFLWDKDEETFNAIVNKTGYSVFNYNDKYRMYRHSKELGAFSLYIMAFVSLLFVFCILITLYFDTYSHLQKDQEQLCHLKGIGITRGEGFRIIKNKVAESIFIPTFTGVLIAVAWCYALNFHRLFEVEISNGIFLSRAIVVGLLYLFVFYFYSVILSHKYFKSVWQA